MPGSYDAGQDTDKNGTNNRTNNIYSKGSAGFRGIRSKDISG